MKTIRRWLVQFGSWLVYAFSEPVEVVHVQTAEDPLFTLARTLTKRQNEKWPERDGECKRAAVYAQMVNSYPDRSKREISRMIEEAL